MKKIYKISFRIDPGLSFYKDLYNADIITNYNVISYGWSYNAKTAIIMSDKKLHDLQLEIRKRNRFAFIIVEVDKYSAYLNNADWEWFNENLEGYKVDTISVLTEKIAEVIDISTTNNDDLLESEFKKIIGLNNVKNDIRKFHKHLEVTLERKKRNLKTDNISLHAIFSGPPGTGKTTFARILGKLYKEIGLLKKGQVIEVDRGDLVAGYIGQTAEKTKEKLNEALDGVLFIDEAYSLSKQDNEKDYGNEVIETILKFMEDHRDRISIIVAGYEDKMNDFIQSNPGLESRFTKSYVFASYSPKELSKIFNLYLRNEDYIISSFHLKSYFIDFFEKYKKNADPTSFGNGRTVRNLFEDLKIIQSYRISKVKDFREKDDFFFKKITVSDIKNLYYKHKLPLPVNKKKRIEK